MKKLYLLPVALLIISCGGAEETESEESTGNETEEVSEEVEETEVVEENPLADLRFKDDGTKWNVTPETDARMDSISFLVNEFREDYVALGTDVHAQVSSIIKECTMEGEDHNQYHIILHATLKESKAMEAGESESVDKLVRYLDAYEQYFELAE